MTTYTEASKKELLLGIDVFNKPAELIGKNAWSQLILNLLFLEPGTYPSMPEMGIGIKSYDYEYMDDVIIDLPSIIQNQVEIYLPDVPLTNVSANKIVSDNGQTWMILVFEFTDNGVVDASAVASEVGKKFLDFEISWG